MTMLDTKKLNRLWAKSIELQNPLREHHMFDLAFFLWNKRQFDESVAVSRTLLDLMAERAGEGLWINTMHLQSMALHDAKRDEEAIEAELLALEYGETLEPASERAFMHWHLADCYRTTGQPELQEAEYLKAIEAFIESENKFFLGQAYIDLANLHYGAGRYDLSKKNFLLAIPVLEETIRTDRMPFVKYRLAGIERHAGNLQAALKYAEEACALAEFTKDTIAERENIIELGLVHAGLGNYEKAISYFDALIDDHSDAAENRSAAKAVFYRAQVLEELSNFPEAKKSYEMAVSLLKVVNLEAMAVNAELALIHLKASKGFE